MAIPTLYLEIIRKRPFMDSRNNSPDREIFFANDFDESIQVSFSCFNTCRGVQTLANFPAFKHSLVAMDTGDLHACRKLASGPLQPNIAEFFSTARCFAKSTRRQRQEDTNFSHVSMHARYSYSHFGRIEKNLST